jgi:cytochrome c peroxidase
MEGHAGRRLWSRITAARVTAARVTAARPTLPARPAPGLLAAPLWALLITLQSCGGADPAPSVGPEPAPAVSTGWSADELALLRRLTPLPPVPADPTNRVADDDAAAHYGRWLFFDARLSGNGEVSCATCHDPSHGFADPRPLARGAGLGERHAPTLLNAAHQRWLGWGGRADSLWMQALGPLENPVEMAGSREAIAELVRADPELSAAHLEVYGAIPADDTALIVEIGKALAAYERRLVRGDSRFDRFAATLLGEPGGDPEALDAREQEGLRLFLGKGRCTLCHLGPTFSDLEFHNNALPPHPEGSRDDPGRYRGGRLVKESPFNAAGPHSDAPDGAAARRVGALVISSETFGEFRTPGLRNLAGREPFGHQGQFEDLAAVLAFYNTLEGQDLRSHHQEQLLRPLGLATEELAALEAFLLALEGRHLAADLAGPPPSPRPTTD